MLLRRIAVVALTAIACIQAAAEPLRAREWFIREGAEGGDGSQAKPFADPWMALDKCEAGDIIHVAEATGITGTPAVLADDGSMLGGYVTPEQLAKQLDAKETPAGK